MTGTVWPSFLCLVFAALLLVAEWRQDRRSVWIFKPLAALFFVLQAIVRGALASPYGTLVLAGLVLSAVGDVLLIPRERRALFRLGMAAFGLAHVTYAAAFLLAVDPARAAGGPLFAAGAMALGFLSWRWLRPHLGGPDRPLVLTYIVLICTMLVTAGLGASGTAPWFVGAGAVMFAVSDLGVARDRFVRRAPANSALITPLYFGAQVLFALSA